MKCYLHSDIDAVGVCSVCGQGVCKNCGVKIGNKLYCRECVNTEFAVKKETVSKLASIAFLVVMFGLSGSFNLLDGLFTIKSGPVLRLLLADLGYFGESAWLGEVFFWGPASVILGAMLLATAYFIWNLKKWGGMLGIVLVLVALTLNLREFVFYASMLRMSILGLQDFAAFVSPITGIAIDSIILVYLRKNWKSLQ